ncbi:Uncharacterised protein [uncultured archaeon]|nr:Uncharacterised protein [uncultured archaeon]
MNLLQIISTTLRLYAGHIGWHLLAGFALLLSTLVACGLLSGTLLVSMFVAAPYGVEGEWVHEPLAVLEIGILLTAGLVAGSWVLLSTLGAFMHTCAQIGAGVREITVLGFLEYARQFGASFWAIGMVQMTLGSIVALPFLLLSPLLSSVWGPLAALGVALAALAFFLIQWPVWLAMQAQVVDRHGAAASIGLAFRTSMGAPLTSFVALALLGVGFVLPLPMLIFYPIYFFFIFAPLSADFGLVYYEAARGLLK